MQIFSLFPALNSSRISQCYLTVNEEPGLFKRPSIVSNGLNVLLTHSSFPEQIVLNDTFWMGFRCSIMTFRNNLFHVAFSL